MASFGPYGNFGETYGTHKVLTCPAGSYITGLAGRAGSNVNKVDSITCRDVVTGARVTVASQTPGSVPNSFGTTNAENPVTVSCNGNDGLTGLRLVADGEVNGLQGTCKPPDNSQPAYFTGLWGHSNWNKDDRCDSLLYQIEGGQSNHGGTHNVTNLRYACKNFAGMQAILNDPVKRGRCAVGDDASAECQEVSASLGKQKADVNAYCASGATISTSKNCQNYYNNDRSNPDYRSIMLSYCRSGANWLSDFCTSYCTASDSASTPAKADCDVLYKGQCDATKHPDNAQLPICSCLQPWTSYPGHETIDQIPGAPQRVSCYFSNCIANGYKPITDSSEPCPACVQSQKISLSNATADVSNIKQVCNVGSAAAATSAPESASVQRSSATSWTWLYWLALVGLMLFALSAFAAVLLL